jgi:hypothetical protein
MTTLAQQLLESDWRPPVGDNQAWAAYKLMMGHLSNNDDPTWRAERFQFIDNSMEEVRKFVNGGALDLMALVKTARMPAERIWIEWKDWGGDPEGKQAQYKIRIGILVEPIVADKHGEELTLIVCGSSDLVNARPIGALATGTFPWKLTQYKIGWGIPTRIIWDGGYDGCFTERSSGINTPLLLQQLLIALFLINTPRVCTTEDVKPAAQLQRARRRRGKLPLIEYKQVRLVIGRPTTRHEAVGHSAGASAGEDAIRKRLHHVLGHFRVYTKRQETPKMAWVPPHWRGDAKLGIVYRDRDVVKETKVVAPPTLPNLES